MKAEELKKQDEAVEEETAEVSEAKEAESTILPEEALKAEAERSKAEGPSESKKLKELETRLDALQQSLERLTTLLTNQQTLSHKETSNKGREREEEDIESIDNFYRDPLGVVRKVVVQHLEEYSKPFVSSMQMMAITNARHQLARDGLEEEFDRMLPQLLQWLQNVDKAYLMRPETYVAAFKMMKAIAPPSTGTKAKKGAPELEVSGVGKETEESEALSLTPQERKVARELGLSEKEYAMYKNVK